MGEALFSLFGPNGQDVPVHSSETFRLAAFKELERHGIVKIVPSNDAGLSEVQRMNRDLFKGGRIVCMNTRCF